MYKRQLQTAQARLWPVPTSAKTRNATTSKPVGWFGNPGVLIRCPIISGRWWRKGFLLRCPEAAYSNFYSLPTWISRTTSLIWSLTSSSLLCPLTSSAVWCSVYFAIVSFKKCPIARKKWWKKFHSYIALVLLRIGVHQKMPIGSEKWCKISDGSNTLCTLISGGKKKELLITIDTSSCCSHQRQTTEENSNNTCGASLFNRIILASLLFSALATQEQANDFNWCNWFALCSCFRCLLRWADALLPRDWIRYCSCYSCIARTYTERQCRDQTKAQGKKVKSSQVFSSASPCNWCNRLVGVSPLELTTCSSSCYYKDTNIDKW